MITKPESVLAKAERRLEPIISDIIGKAQKQCGKGLGLIERLHNDFVNKLPEKGTKYTVSSDCAGCDICATVCPADNIIIKDGEPIFGAACEGCVACIQFCPKRAINFGKTTERRRYTHPQISHKELADFYGNGNKL